LTFPERVGDAQIGPVRDHETTNPGYGYVVRYLKPGWDIDVSIYDRGAKPVPNDLGSAVIKRELEYIEGAIFFLRGRGGYSDVSVKRRYTLRDGSGRGRFVCVDFTLTRKGGDADSFLCLTGWNGAFVNLRLTTSQHAGSDREAAAFVNAWVGVLWP
jgi:hypothetical protein